MLAPVFTGTSWRFTDGFRNVNGKVALVAVGHRIAILFTFHFLSDVSNEYIGIVRRGLFLAR